MVVADKDEVDVVVATVVVNVGDDDCCCWPVVDEPQPRDAKTPSVLAEWCKLLLLLLLDVKEGE